MIPGASTFGDEALELALRENPVVQRYRAFFALLDWSQVPERLEEQPWPGSPPHPERAYLKALLVKLVEQKVYITDLRKYLLDHPLLVLELGFRPVLDPTQRYGFALEATVPGDRWLRHKQQTLDNTIIQALLRETVHALQHEIPDLGTTIAIDVKHIYAWVVENNLKAYVTERYNPERQPQGDPDCRLGVKRSTNQERPDGTVKERKEYVWGYGTGVVATTDPQYGDVVIADYTQPFNETDPTTTAPSINEPWRPLDFSRPISRPMRHLMPGMSIRMPQMVAELPPSH